MEHLFYTVHCTVQNKHLSQGFRLQDCQSGMRSRYLWENTSSIFLCTFCKTVVQVWCNCYILHPHHPPYGKKRLTLHKATYTTMNFPASYLMDTQCNIDLYSFLKGDKTHFVLNNKEINNFCSVASDVERLHCPQRG